MEYEEDLESYYKKTKHNNSNQSKQNANKDDDDYDNRLFTREKIEIKDFESVNELLGYESSLLDITLNELNVNPDATTTSKPSLLPKRKRAFKCILILGLFGLIVSTLVAVIVTVVIPKRMKKEYNNNPSTLQQANITTITAETLNNDLKGKDSNNRNKENIFLDSFYVDLPSFSYDTMNVYTSCSNLLSDVEQAAKYLSNLIIQNAFNDDYIFNAAAYDGHHDYDDDNTASTADSFDTNNQVDGVDEADIVKSDGENFYLVYGNELVVVSVDNGEILSRTPMPQINFSFPVASYWNPMDVIQQEELLDDDYVGATDSSSNSTFSARSSVKPPYYSPAQKTRSLLLYENRLAVIVEGYQFSSNLIFLNGAVTTILLYDINRSDGTLTLVDKTTIRGILRDARSIHNQVHVVTVSHVNSSRFSSYVKSWMFSSTNITLQQNNSTDEEYRKKAYARARALIPQFAKQLVAELLGNTHDGSVDDYSCNHIFRMSLMRNGISTDEIPDLTAGNGILNSYVQITSFDMQSKFSLTESVAGVFLPTTSLNVYSSKDMLVMAAQGWKRTDVWKENTYLMGFDISNGAARPAAIGEVPGYLLNQYSLDYHDGHLRAATTLSGSWGMVNGEWIRKTESQNLITILERNGNKLLSIGQLSNIATGERIYSVRFMQDKAYVVTFKQIDPFFTFDLSDPTQPIQVGALKITGFSNYLHPIEDEKFILAVGQDTNETTGMPMGLQISLFNTTNFANPSLTHKFMIQSDTHNGYNSSSSDTQYDTKAFRYIKCEFKLTLPVSKYSYNTKEDRDNDSFDGFQVYNINELEGITKVGEVIHADANLIARSCFSWAYIPPRSMVFNSKLLTMKGHTIVMTNSILDPTNTLWTIDLDEERTATDVAGCMPWFS